MSPETAVPAPRHWLYWALGCWAVALLVVFAGFVAVFHSGPWSAAAEPWSVAGSQLTLRGPGRVEGSRIVMEGTGADGIALAAVNLESPLEARHFRFVTVRASGALPSGGLSFAWRVRGQENAVRRLDLVPSGGRLLPAALGSLDGWGGSVVGVGVIAKGEFRGPFAVESIELRPSSVWTTIGGLFAAWLEFEPWDGGSIHFMSGGNPALKHPLPLFAGLGLAVAIGLYLLLVVLGHTRFRAPVLLAMAFLSWAVIDARWQLNLWRQLDITRWQYAGKSWEDKRRAAEDGRLFEFMLEAKRKIGEAPAHVFVFADDEYDRVRGAYHLYPKNVTVQPRRQSLLPAETFRPGDVLVLYRKRGVEFNPAQKSLRWDGTQSLKAEMVLFSEGSAVFRVLGPG